MGSWPGTCRNAGGASAPDEDGDVHTHVCGEDKGHEGGHSCELCDHTW